MFGLSKKEKEMEKVSEMREITQATIRQEQRKFFEEHGLKWYRPCYSPTDHENIDIRNNIVLLEKIIALEKEIIELKKNRIIENEDHNSVNLKHRLCRHEKWRFKGVSGHDLIFKCELCGEEDIQIYEGLFILDEGSTIKIRDIEYVNVGYGLCVKRVVRKGK